MWYKQYFPVLSAWPTSLADFRYDSSLVLLGDDEVDVIICHDRKVSSFRSLVPVVVASEVFLAEIPLRSPRKLLIFII